MRLIDADAFCAFLREVSTRQNYETLLIKKDKFPTVADVIEAICCDLDGTCLNGFDNAPTVEPFEPDYVGAERLKARQRGYEKGYQYGMKIGKTLNPKIKQGEWIIDKNTRNTICSRCRKSRRDTRTEHIYFCNHCGAKMLTAQHGGEE